MTTGKDQPHKKPKGGLAAPAVIAAAVFITTIIATAPASLFGSAIAGDPRVAYQSIEGTLWRGVVRGASFAGKSMGDIEFVVHPSALLRGAAEIDVAAEGGVVRGRGRIARRFDGGVVIEDATVTGDIAAVGRYYLLGAPLGGAARAEIDRLTMTQAGCVEAEGVVWTNVLDSPARRFDREPTDLTGALACEGNALRVSLMGSTEDGALDFVARISPDLQYDVEARVSAAPPELAAAIKSFGFEENSGALVYQSIGELRRPGT